MEKGNISHEHICISEESQKSLAGHSKLLIINIILTGILSITATLGNLLIFVAIWRSVHLRSPSMILLSGLAVSDLCVGLISEPLFIALDVIILKKNTASCFLTSINVMAFTFLTDVSLLTITAISVDRYLAIYCHLRYEQVVTKTRVKIAIASLWIISGLHLLTLISGNETLSTVTAIELSVCLVTVLFIWIKIYQVVRYHRTQIQDQLQAQAQQFNMARFRKSAITNFVILIVFLLCYIPYFILSSLLAYEFNNSTFMICHFNFLLVFCNSSLNPLLYCYRNNDIRAAVKATLSQCLCQAS